MNQTRPNCHLRAHGGRREFSLLAVSAQDAIRIFILSHARVQKVGRVGCQAYYMVTCKSGRSLQECRRLLIFFNFSLHTILSAMYALLGRKSAKNWSDFVHLCGLIYSLYLLCQLNYSFVMLIYFFSI